jgi:hypothetical protein
LFPHVSAEVLTTRFSFYGTFLDAPAPCLLPGNRISRGVRSALIVRSNHRLLLNSSFR